MDQGLITTVRKTLESKSTEELRKIYDAGNLSAWSLEAFEAIRRILSDRGESGLQPLPSEQSHAHSRAKMKPRAVTRSRRPAGFWIRVVATLIDGIILVPFVLIAFYVLLFTKSLPIYLLLSIPALVYKPFMESRYGATLGKMACGLQVIDHHGRWLSLGAAYLRFSPQLVHALVGIGCTIWVFFMPEFQAVSGLLDLGQLLDRSPGHLINTDA